MSLAEVLAVTVRVARILEGLSVPYLVGGSVASSLHGTPRATHDVDLVADLRERHVGPFLEAVTPDFYVDAGAVADAVAQRRSFNLIDQATVLKIDIFVLKTDPLSQDELARSVRVTLPADPPEELVVASAEDIVLQKLLWYQLGEGVSDRQWLDVLGVLKVRGATLDYGYLTAQAERAGLSELLDRACAEAGHPLGS